MFWVGQRGPDWDIGLADWRPVCLKISLQGWYIDRGEIMTTPRAGRWLKLDRAKEHLKSLHIELESVYKSCRPEIPLTCGFDPHDQSWVCRVGEFRRVGSATAGPLIGDTVQNLRAALDFLIWDLSILDLGSWPLYKNGQELRTQFPVCLTKDIYDSTTVQMTYLDSINSAHREKIERFQPYITRDDTLELLRNISNEDKHRVIQTVFSMDIGSSPYVRGASDCEVVGGGGVLPIIQGPLKPNTEILRLPLTKVGPNPKVDVIFQAAIVVAFRDGNGVSHVLTKAAMLVEEILEVFESDLSTPQAQAIRQAADAAHT